MTNWVQWFRDQLKASGDGFIWAFEQLPKAYHYKLPPAPKYLGTWPPIRHIWHVTGYERALVIPSMRQWLGEPLATVDRWQNDDLAFEQARQQGLDEIVAEFYATRQQQIDLLAALTSVDWEAPRETLWGNKPLKMVVTKTYQHTFEHGDTLLRMGLWWEEIAREQAAQK